MLTEAGLRDPKCKCPAGGRPRPDSLLPGVTWCTCEPQDIKDPTIAVKDKTTEMEETSRSGNTPGVGEAREPAAVARKVGKTMTAKNREDKDTAENVRPSLQA